MPPAMTSFASIVDFDVTFATSTAFPDAATDLNAAYSTNLVDPGAFFTDGHRHDARSSSELLSILKDQIVDYLIVPLAAPNTDPALVHAALSRAAITVAPPNGTFRRLNHANMMTALKESLALNSTAILFQVNFFQVAFATPTSSGLNFITWEDTTALATNAPANAPPAPNTVPTTAFLSQAISQLVTGLAAANLGSQPGVNTTPSASAPTPSAGSMVFNHRNLPSDVLDRFSNKESNGLLLGSIVSAPFANGNFYHLESIDKIITSDGTLFIHTSDLNEKELSKATLSCTDDTHFGIRAWYDRFSKQCMNYGFYVHPLWCFRRDHGGEYGFTCGNSPDDDLPDFMALKLKKMSPVLYNLLIRKDMFPKDSRCPGLVSSCTTGYGALLRLLQRSHPSYVPQPDVMTAAYPTQGEMDLYQYSRVYQDFLQLKAFVLDSTSTLDRPGEVDLFINSLKFSTFLNRKTLDDRDRPSSQHKYVGAQLLTTLSRFLDGPDSPALRFTDQHAPPGALDPRSGKPPTFIYPRKSYPRPPPRPAVHHIASDHLASLSPDPSSDPHDNHVEDPFFLATLHSIKTPTDTTALGQYHQYCASVHRIHTDPTAAVSSKCIVCGDIHRFDACPVLQNAPFLRSHYIRYCQHLRKEEAARSLALGDGAGPNPTPSPALAGRPLRFIAASSNRYDALSIASSPSDRSSSPPLEDDDLHQDDSLDLDFQHGRV